MTSLLERYILVRIEMNATRDHYISTTFLAVTVFLFTLTWCGNKEHDKGNHRNMKRRGVPVTIIGRKYSTWLYILHPIFITGIGTVTDKVGIYKIYSFVAPLIIYIVTIIFLILWDRFKNMITNWWHQLAAERR